MIHLRQLLPALPVIGMLCTAYAEIQIDENLQDKMHEVGPNGTVSALIYMDDQVDIKSLSDSISRDRFTRSARHELVVETLQNVATDSQRSM